MSFTGAIRILNDLKTKKVIRDYAIFDAVAATAYMEPITTEDMHIIALADDDEEYLWVFRRVSGLAERIEGMHIVLDDVPVQIFPTSLKPIYRDALD